MHPLRLYAFGHPRLPGVLDLEAHYLKLLRPVARMEVMEIPEIKGDPAQALKREAVALQTRLKGTPRPILLDAGGPQRSSEELATWLGAKLDRGEVPTFVLGSSHGFDPSIKALWPDRLSLSPLTFPHDLARVMLLEQLFRSLSILRGGPYHK